MSTAMVAKYGAEALDKLREAKLMLKMVAALGQLEKRPWAGLADEWERTLAQLVGQMEDTELREGEEEEGRESANAYPCLPIPERLESFAERHMTVLLRVGRKDGRVETVEYEPYRIHPNLRTGQLYLLCYHTLHEHIERLPLRSIIGIVGEGRRFEPRWDVEA